MVHCIPSKTLGQTPPPLDGWGGPAPFAVWAEPAWSPRGGWVNKLLLYWLVGVCIYVISGCVQTLQLQHTSESLATGLGGWWGKGGRLLLL